MLRVGLDGLRARLAAPGNSDDLAAARVVVVDCDGATGGSADVEEMIAGIPAVFVAAGREAETVGLDVLAADDQEIDRIVAAVERAPLAAVALVVLLRGGERRTIGEGLVAESATYSLLQAGPEHRSWLAGLQARSRPDTGPPVRMTRKGDELRITLNRPAVHNAYSAAMRDSLLDGLAVAQADRNVRVVLDGSGPSFCSGGDLSEFGTAPDPATAHIVRLRRSAARAVAAVADRVTVRVHGSCAGAGVELPAFAGRVEARAETRFWLPEVGMGLVPGAGGTVSLPRRIGRQRTARLALTGEAIDAPTARAWGLVDAVVDEHDAG